MEKAYGMRIVGENLVNPNKGFLINQNIQKDISYLHKLGAISKYAEIKLKKLCLETVDDAVRYAAVCFDESSSQARRNYNLKQFADAFDIEENENMLREVAKVMDNLTEYASNDFVRKYDGSIDVLNKNIKRAKHGKKIRPLEVIASN